MRLVWPPNILLEARAEPNKGKRNESTPLINAVARGHRDVAKMLLDSGADPNLACADWGRAPLHYIPIAEYNDVVKLLLDFGADPNKVDDLGNTPMHEVAWRSHKTVAKLLVQKGAKVDEASDEGTTPLHIASGVHHDLVNFLIDQGADPRKQDRYGFTPWVHRGQLMRFLLRRKSMSVNYIAREAFLVSV